MALHAVQEMFYAECWFEDFMYLVGDENWKAERREQVALLREIFGNPFRPVAIDRAWKTPTVLSLATAASDNRLLPAGTLERARLGILADALEDAGCPDQELLLHIRSPGPHLRGCFAVDLILDRK
jgi:hypothetical protein